MLLLALLGGHALAFEQSSTPAQRVLEASCAWQVDGVERARAQQ